MFSTILIANRGEIACRIMRTAQRMGIACVAVYSDADANACHVAMAEDAVHIGPSPAGESYLSGERIIAAARASGAQAIHPGYGFLSEDPAFAEAVEAAGLVFIGPKPGAMRAMALKDAAKRTMEEAGVPVVPGYHGQAQELVLLAGKAREIGYPVLIKARAGGGGRGMRRVDEPGQFAEALSAARREAKAAFGDDHVLLEKYVEKPRHIEIQIFGDSHGNVVHLYERDCSAQRRHQKVVEEAPAPGMTEALREAMLDAAVRAGRAIGYCGAGTVEFIVDASQGLRADRFWFMEMNTRLQVEHPVSEMVTGIDLVEWQLRVAAGEPLPRRQEDIALSGHAVEARIYAEDPARGFLPATGTLHHLHFARNVEGARLRVETGVREGDTVSSYYDPMIAKLVVHGPDRAAALLAMGAALSKTQIAGTRTNTAFLAALVADGDFAAGDLDTGLIERRHDRLVAASAPDEAAKALAALAASGARSGERSGDPWQAMIGYAHFTRLRHRVTLRHGDEAIVAHVSARADGRFDVEIDGGAGRHVLGTAADNGNGREVRSRFVLWPGHVTVFSDGKTYDFVLADPLARQGQKVPGLEGLRAPMPGLVTLVHVAAGDAVSKGQPLLVLEAMKMEHQITAPHAGVIDTVAAQGERVSEGTVLARFAAGPEN